MKRVFQRLFSAGHDQRYAKGIGRCRCDAAGNAFLPAFIDDYNARFAKVPLEDRDVHRPLAGHDDLDDAFAWKEERSVSMNLTLQYDQVLFILEPTGIARSLARKRVTVIDYPDGRLAIRYDGVDGSYTPFLVWKYCPSIGKHQTPLVQGSS